MKRRLMGLTLVLMCQGSVVDAAGLQFEDRWGGRVELSGPARRIISLAPSLTELVFAVGAGGALVGVSRYSDYPPAAKRIPRVSDAMNADFETIVAMQPDVILAWRSGTPKRVVERLQGLDLPVLSFEPRRTVHIAETLMDLGRLTGNEDTARAAAEQFIADIEALRRRFSSRETVTVFYAIYHQPLMTLNAEHIVSEVIELCGGKNLFAELPQLAPVLNREAVLQADPEVMLISSTIREVDQLLDKWRRWLDSSDSDAVHVYPVDANLINRPSLRLVEGARQLCALIERARVTPPELSRPR